MYKLIKNHCKSIFEVSEELENERIKKKNDKNIDKENMKSMRTNIEQLANRVADFEVNVNILSESLNALDDRVKALEGGGA